MKYLFKIWHETFVTGEGKIELYFCQFVEALLVSVSLSCVSWAKPSLSECLIYLCKEKFLAAGP